tara:strand:- start:542 stop:1174 length:633 start_codon:yes stop_codon:yes gene_type:complete
MFYRIKVNNQSIAQRKLLYGVGVNDSWYKTHITINGKDYICRLHNLWSAMLERCYCEKTLRRKPDYFNCYVSDEWLVFSNFLKWIESQDIKDKQLDKDILITGNRVYSSATCLMVPQEINKLLVIKDKTKGLWPNGVSRVKLTGRFISYCAVNGKNKGLGTYDTPEEAKLAYDTFKGNHVYSIALKQKDNKLKESLIRISSEIKNGTYYK